MLLSRAKAVLPSTVSQSSAVNQVPELSDLLLKRDYSGSVALLQHLKRIGKENNDYELWTAFALFHSGHYSSAQEIYERHNDLASLAVCLFFLGRYSEAKRAAERADRSSALVRRLFLHLSLKTKEAEVGLLEQQMTDSVEDQLSVAAVHFVGAHYQEAIDIYKRLLSESRELLALNVFVALCYYKLDYYDVSQEVLALYVQRFADSVLAVNLKACNLYRLYNGKTAEQELTSLIDRLPPNFEFAKDLLRHNLVVFRGGDGALQVLPSLVDVLPEAKLNLVIYHLKNDDLRSAETLMKDVEPINPNEYVLKGVVSALVAQRDGSKHSLKEAQQYLQMVGGSASECDTISGRQCMASCFFLMKQFEDVLLYLSSIKSYFYNDDTFNLNFAQAKAATGQFRDAEDAFAAVRSSRVSSDIVMVQWIARCYIMNGKPLNAWKLCESSDSVSLLTIVANDCYKMGHFLVAAKAFDSLQRIDGSAEHWEGKRGSIAGLLQMACADKADKEDVAEALRLVRGGGGKGAPSGQTSQLINAMKNWSSKTSSNEKQIE
ncbi:intraflagellar transport protein 56-like [Oppia nitens]|uniref:intraflagellar transport protein 56-like n=1 Tax=Oppia nitens TaxID=1686743 RepID=UPI0023DA14CC|nr:intraflagellar transport protein 56-like [Oppia nitens]